MIHLALVAALVAPQTAAHPARHQHHQFPARFGGCQSWRCVRRVRRRLRVRLTSRPPFASGTATYYSPGSCDSTGGGNTTASGTTVHFGEVAQSTLPLGTRIYVAPAIRGEHVFTVEDRFGSPQAPGRLDVWLPCGESIPNPWETIWVLP